MKIAETSQNMIIEALNDFCTKSDVKASENMTLIASDLQENKGNVKFETLLKALNTFTNGQSGIKAPFRINNRFLNLLIQEWFDRNMKTSNAYQDYQTERPAAEKREMIWLESMQINKLKFKDWIRGIPMYFNPFFFFLSFDYMVTSGKLENFDPDIAKVYELKNRFKHYDKHSNYNVTSPIKTPRMTDEDYRKAAIVALYSQEHI